MADIYFILVNFTYHYPLPIVGEFQLKKLFSALIIALIVGAICTTMVMAKETVRVSGSTTVLPLAEGGA
jgi:hypothetical protein